MDVSVIGRVNNLNLPITKGVLPVFEAVVNSIQACIGNINNRIELHIIRKNDQPELINDESLVPEIDSFIIMDNGIGFNPDNYHSFTTSDSTKKMDIGGKGVGRFLWLKAFDCAEVDSLYVEDNKTYNRKFKFIMKGDGIDEHSVNTSDAHDIKTRVLLRNVKAKYSKYMPKKASSIAQRLFDYCLSYYISGDGLNIYVIDDFTGESISLLGLYETLVKRNTKTINFRVVNRDFTLSLIRYPTTQETMHKIVYCAHKREVKSENMSDFIPLLYKRLSNDDTSEFVLCAYITGDYLDNLVNSERTDFILNDDDNVQDLEFDDLISIREIRNIAVPIIKDDIDSALSDIKRAHTERIAKLVHEQIPEYRSVLKYRSDDVYSISPALSNDKIEVELYKLQQRMEVETKQKSKKLIESEPKTEEEEKEYYINYGKMAEELSDLGKDKLVQYIIHRKAIIRLFENRLKKKDDGDYPLEEAIHQLIIPMRITSDDTDYNKQNLWIIDEKLAYHYYLASDKRLKRAKKGESAKRPDLIVFDKPIAFTDDTQPYSSIVIVEFKRPQRDDYSDSDNPITQVQEYIRIIRRGEAEDKDGRPIIINETSKFYVYIICDITKKLDELAENQSAIKSPDNMGYFWFNPYLKTYFEIIPFEKLLEDSKKRNRVLFEKLGLPLSIND